MKILFIHPNMPGQYKHLARVFAADPANEVVFITKPRSVNIPNVTKVEYEVKRDSFSDLHRYLIPFERAVFQGQEVWRVCNKLKQAGFVPDVICGHLGWGDGLFLKDVYPDVPVLAYMEFFYEGNGADMKFSYPEGVAEDDKARVRMKNALHLFNLAFTDWMHCPTFFQRDRHPKDFWPRMSVIHDGIDTNEVAPNPDVSLQIPGGMKLTRKDEVITYISRNFEDYRGFPQFMEAAAEILKRRPNARILMVGADGVSYGKAYKGKGNYREDLCEKYGLTNHPRFHYLGTLPYHEMIGVLQVSSAHIYLTVPFVLSWSMMEAMSAGCLMIGSNTEPVQEVLQHDVNGLMVDMLKPLQIADAVDSVFAHPTRMQHLRDAARQTILDKYSMETLLPLQIQLIKDVANRQLPPPTAAKIAALYQDKVPA